MVKKSPADLQKLMHISPKLAELNFDRFQDWQTPFTPDTARAAVLAFNGDVYTGLEAHTFSERDFTHAQKVFRIFLDSKDGKPHKIVSFFAKRARGSMSKFLIKNRVTTLKGITEFDGMGYRFDAGQSTPDRPVFTRSN